MGVDLRLKGCEGKVALFSFLRPIFPFPRSFPIGNSISACHGLSTLNDNVKRGRGEGWNENRCDFLILILRF